MSSGNGTVMRPMAWRALTINWVFAATNLSGGTKSNRLLAEAMVRRGHTVRLLYSDLPDEWPPIWRVRRWWRRVRHEWRLRGRRQHHLERSTAELIPVRARPIPAEAAPDADFAVATWWATREWIEGWPRAKGRPVYMVRHHELHGGDPARVAATYQLPGQKFVISSWLARVMAETYGDRGCVLTPNGVDRAQFHAEPRSKSGVPTVGVLYGHVAWKGAETAFRAIRLAQRRAPELRVVSFGFDPIGPGVEVPANFEFHLRPGQGVIPELYRRCDCWLVPSTLEGFGMPGLEAAACRCPLVSTRCGGPEDYIEDGVNGYLVDVGDAEAMADRMLDVVRAEADAWRRMSDASHEISLRFDWDRSAGIMEERLLAILESERAAAVVAGAGRA